MNKRIIWSNLLKETAKYMSIGVLTAVVLIGIVAMVEPRGSFAQDTPGLAGPISAALLGTSSNGKAIAITLGTNLSLAGTTLNASGGSSNLSCGGIVGTSMTGSDVTMCTFTVPALAAGACYTFQGAATSTANGTFKIFAGATQISMPIDAAVGAAGDIIFWNTAYCNNPSSQTVQTLTPLLSFYSAAAGYHQGNNLNAGTQFLWLEGSNSVPPTYPITPTGVNWATSQTVTLKINAASGTASVYAFKIY